MSPLVAACLGHNDGHKNGAGDLHQVDADPGRLVSDLDRTRFGGDNNPGAKKKAITAIAHTLLKIAYQVLKTGTPCQEPGADFCTKRESPAQRQAYLERQFQKLRHPRLHHHHHHQPPGGRLTTQRLATRPQPARPGAAAVPVFAAQLIEKAGSRLVITDLRSAPAELEVTFSGTLRAEQRVAVDAAAAHELGVLVAPPGAGKTVMGCSVIARHQVPTLILVDRTPLVDQWKERLREHLSLGPREIGQLGGGKKTKLTGRIDLATLQALTRADDPAKILSEYGLVIVNECHHVAAKTFAAAIRSIRRDAGSGSRRHPSGQTAARRSCSCTAGRYATRSQARQT